jgi:endonuclease-3
MPRSVSRKARPKGRNSIVSVLRALGRTYDWTALNRLSEKRRSPFRTLIATILSQRTRDEITDEAARRLFARFRTPEKLARARKSEILPLIRACGFYRVKTDTIRRVARLLVERHGGRVPETMDELTALPGVGRKTAGCVLVYGFAKDAIPVDTHVHRISNRLGWLRTKTPGETEITLQKIVPRRFWQRVNDLLVSHGRTVCRPIGPRCGACSVERWCAKAGVGN